MIEPIMQMLLHYMDVLFKELKKIYINKWKKFRQFIGFWVTQFFAIIIFDNIICISFISNI